VKKSFIIAAIILFCTPLVATENVKMDDNKKEFETIDPVYQKTNVNTLVEIESATDIANKRATLVELIWGENGFPENTQPDQIHNAFRDQRYDDIDALKQIDKLTFNRTGKLISGLPVGTADGTINIDNAVNSILCPLADEKNACRRVVHNLSLQTTGNKLSLGFKVEGIIFNKFLFTG
jgi:hypothetical protein